MKKPKAIVIGSGFGGLSLAIRLQAAGFETKIYEKRDKPGGRAYVYRQDGFTFDAGPTVITAPTVLEELFQLGGRRMEDYVQMVPVAPFYRLCWEDGSHFDYSNDDENMQKEFARFDSSDWKGYQKFLKYSAEVFKKGYTDLAHVPFPSFFSMVKVAPDLMKLQAFRSVYSMVSSFIKNEKLRQAFSFHSLLVGGNPFETSSIYTLIHHLERNWGVYFPLGGTHALVRGLLKLYGEMGGRIELSAEVDEIVSENGKVQGIRLANGQLVRSDLVVSNAEVAHTYNKLLKNENQATSQRRWVNGRKFSMSLFLIYFGTNKKYENIEHHSVLFGPRYKEHLKDIFRRGKVADDFSLYLHRPTKTDARLAPQGCDSFYVLAPVPHLGLSDYNWKTESETFEKRVLDYLEKYYLPDLQEHIVTKRVFTPLDFEQQLNSQFGAAFSIEPVLTQSAYFRTQNKDKKIEGLYFVGAGTHPGAGVPGVVNSAKATMGIIAEDFPTTEVQRPKSPGHQRSPEATL